MNQKYIILLYLVLGISGLIAVICLQQGEIQKLRKQVREDRDHIHLLQEWLRR